MKLSSYTIAANCTDITDLKDGIEEVRATICKYREEGKLIPSYFYVRLSKLEKKLIKFQKKEDMSTRKVRGKQIYVTPKEYEAILLGLSEMETTVMAGDLSDSELKNYEYNISNIRNLINKIGKE